MADDGRSGDGDLEDDVPRGEAHDGSMGDGDRHDAATDGLAAEPSGAARVDADGDPVASEMGALFAAALADEPPSSVTAESVLREARGDRPSARGGFGAWLASGPLSLKWAGGLVAAAALVGAVIVVAPMMGGSAQNSADSGAVAGSQMYDSAAEGGAGGVLESSAESLAAADSAGSVAAAEAAPLSGLPEMPASSESSQGASPDGGYSESSSEAPAAPTAAAGATSSGAGTAERSASDSDVSSADEAPPQSSPARDCSLPPLEAGEWSAAVAALPDDVALTRVPGSSCVDGALRSNGIEIRRGGEQGATLLWIVVSRHPTGRDGAASDSTVVSATRGEVTATLITHQNGDPWLEDAALQRVVDAVVAAG